MEKIYDIYDNGGVPFKCKVLNKDKKIIVFKAIYDEEGELIEYKYVFSRYYEKIFIGDDPLDFSGEGYNEDFIGNSILIKMLNGKYMYIGSEIYEFNTEGAGVQKTLSTEGADEILEFYSYVGNSGVPYPFAIGKKYTYLFTMNYKGIGNKFGDNIPGSKIPRVKIPNKLLKKNQDAYTQYYENPKIRAAEEPFSVKMIVKRL
jgi:hypothetical protein